jgi:hypothetical protein
MNARLVVALGAALTLLGCNPAPRKVGCETYVAGSFTADNNYALSVDAPGWPLLDNPTDRIELTFFLANSKPQTVELVHVLDSHELERWTLHIPVRTDGLATCLIAPDPKFSTCDASVQMQPQSPGGYYYLRTGGEFLEAGMSFVLCR